MLLYGNQHLNEISSQFTRETEPHLDLMRYFHGLMLSSSKAKAMKVVERLAKWSWIVLDATTSRCFYTEFMEAFDNYQTLYLKASGHQRLLDRVEKVTMT